MYWILECAMCVDQYCVPHSIIHFIFHRRDGEKNNNNFILKLLTSLPVVNKFRRVIELTINDERFNCSLRCHKNEISIFVFEIISCATKHAIYI